MKQFKSCNCDSVSWKSSVISFGFLLTMDTVLHMLLDLLLGQCQHLTNRAFLLDFVLILNSSILGIVLAFAVDSVLCKVAKSYFLITSILVSVTLLLSFFLLYNGVFTDIKALSPILWLLEPLVICFTIPGILAHFATLYFLRKKG